MARLVVTPLQKAEHDFYDSNRIVLVVKRSQFSRVFYARDGCDPNSFCRAIRVLLRFYLQLTSSTTFTFEVKGRKIDETIGLMDAYVVGQERPP